MSTSEHMESSKKQYGLLIPKKTPAVIVPVLKKPAAFNSDSDEEHSIDWISKTAKKENYGSGKSRQTKADIERILKDDPTAYQYDEIYDDMKKKKDETAAALKNDKKPKYMSLLLKQAERRKKEDERRKERQIQKEREAEGDEFADKEVFITSSYKKKLEEIRNMDEDDKRMERLEDIGDVTKQCDLGGFYRHLYESMSTAVELPGANSAAVSNTSAATAESTAKFRGFDKKKTRNIRKRVTSDGENDAESETERRVADKKTKKSTDDEVDPEISKSTVTPVELISPRVPAAESGPKDPSKEMKTEPRSDGDDNDDDDDDSQDEDDDDDENDAKPVKIEPNKKNVSEKKKRIVPQRRIDIWVKRTVGQVFEAALQRYHERQSSTISTC